MGCSASNPNHDKHKPIIACNNEEETKIKFDEKIIEDTKNDNNNNDGKEQTQRKDSLTSVTSINVTDGNNNTTLKHSAENKNVNEKEDSNTLADLKTLATIKRKQTVRKMDYPKELRPRSISILTDDGAYEESDSDEIFITDSHKLNEAMSLTQTNEKNVINIIVRGNNERVEKLKEIYLQEYDEDLIKAIKRNIGGTVQYILTNILLPTEEYVANLMRRCMEQKDYVLLTEVLSSWKPQVIQSAKLLYKDRYIDSFENDVKTSLDQNVTETLKNVILPLSYLQRNNVNVESLDEPALIFSDVDQLNEGADKIIEVLTQIPCSTTRLAVLFEQYKLKYYLDIKDTIDLEFHDDAQTCLKTIVRIASNASQYFAKELKAAVMENNEDRIVHIIVSRYQNDLANIKEIYNDLDTDQSLAESIQNGVSSDIQYLLLRLIKKSRR